VTRAGIFDDPVALSALGLSALLFFLWRKSPRFDVSNATALTLLSGLAFALSAGYVAHYLRGGPRIVDATTYYLQARTYATGQLGFLPETPEASHFGRFLLSMPDGRLSSLFPPGYPAVLALGFLLGAPMWVGPMLAAALTLVTYLLAYRWFGDRRVALLAAALSALCAALRYHTADTMAHGFCALLTALALLGVASSKPTGAAFAGLSLGWLFATRPVSALALGPVLLVVILLRPSSPRDRTLRVAGMALCLVGVALFAWQQQEVTGVWGVSTQYRYYSLADDPGCFRYGFGADIGCRGEHGAFVEKYLPNGYGPFEAAWTTLRRLALHARDAGNSELFGALVLVALWLGRKEARVRVLGLALLVHVVAYAGFYFDGNYPGGGARMFADVLPLEHLLLAWLFVHVEHRSAYQCAETAPKKHPSGVRAFFGAPFALVCAPLGALGVRFVAAIKLIAALAKPRLALPLVTLGFAVRTSFDHAELAERDGGSPMYDAALVAGSAPPNALVFVSSDHGYALGHAPRGEGPLVVREKHDALDFAAWQEAGKPPAFRYHFDFASAGAVPELVAFLPKATTRFELENQWPPLALDGVARRSFEPRCAADGVTLEGRGAGARLLASVWVATAGPKRVTLRALGDVGLTTAAGPVPLEPAAGLPGCALLWGELHAPRAGNLHVWVSTPARAWLDALEVAEPR
jgi:hypothetical protein